MCSSGRRYSWPRAFTDGAWLMPTPSRNRPGYASHNPRAPFAIAFGSRPQTFAMPVAIGRRSVSASSTAAWLIASRLPWVSGNHSAP